MRDDLVENGLRHQIVVLERRNRVLEEALEPFGRVWTTLAGGDELTKDDFRRAAEVLEKPDA